MKGAITSPPFGDTVGTAQQVLLGCATFGGIGSLPDLFGRGDDRDTAFALMTEAWDGGIRWFDTADAYAGGISESWIGDWIQGSGHQPKLTSKTFNPMSPGGDHGLSRERVLRQLSSSLERLGVNRLDFYLLHEFDSETPIDETVGLLEELRSQRVIGEWGASNFTARQLDETLTRAGRPALLQNSFSLLERRDELDVIPLCVDNGIAYQAYSPLAGGWLSGKYRSEKSPPPNSRLALVPQWYEHIDQREAFLAVKSLAAIAESEGTSMSALAHAWVRKQPNIDGMVVGPRSHEHFASVWKAMQEGIPLETLERLSLVTALENTDR